MQFRHVALAFKPFRDMFVFAGRSRRTEVVAFFILGTLANGVTVELLKGGVAQTAIGAGWSLLWSFPWLALLVRRLHDQGRSARWAWALFAVILALLATAPLLPQSADGDYRVTLVVRTFHPVGPLAIVHGVVAAIWAVASLFFYLAPEQVGTNRYGPDPRLDPEDWKDPVSE